jgi:serine O-acetyltransferase
MRQTSAKFRVDYLEAPMGSIIWLMRADILHTYNMSRDSTLRRNLNCVREPGLHAVLVYRFGHWLRGQNIFIRLTFEPVYLLLYRHIRTAWGIEIARSTEIGPGFHIGHFGGITISRWAKIGRNVAISQGVTIGVSGRGENWGAPEIGDDVFIGPHAVLIAKIHIGNNVIIGPNTVIKRDIPDNAVAALDPGFAIISHKGNRRQAAIQAG